MNKQTLKDYYEAGQLSVYARLIREHILSVEMIAELTTWNWAHKAKALSCSQQCIDGPWEFMKDMKIDLECVPDN